MDWAGWALFGLLATAILTSIMIVAQLTGWTRLDLPLVLGTMVTQDPDHARVVGFLMHLAIGEGFALGYAVGFALLDTATWWLGALFGLVHVAVALTILVPLLPGVHPRMASERAGPASVAVLEPPGLLGLNYGLATPAVAIGAHVAYGVALGVLLGARVEMPGDSRRPIADYGLMGDTRTAALVSSEGSIDWMCAPHFDGDPIFARLVGGEMAGQFRIGPATPSVVVARSYRPHTATLETVWETDTGRLTLVEGMVAELAGHLLPPTLLVRRLTVEGEPTEVVVDFDPRFGAKRRGPRVERRGPVLVCSSGSLAVALDAGPGLSIEPGVPSTLSISPGQPLTFVLAIADRAPLIYVEPQAAWAALEADERRWQQWSDGVADDVVHREMVLRSLITLRLLTYSPSGAPVAAPTTSLPEVIGGVRNWDYRFAWPHGTPSIGVGAFLGVGKDSEARMFLAWLLHASRLDRPRLPVLLSLHGKHSRPERVLDGWPGYADSRPVRVGNGAADQHQLDTYGWVLDAAWLFTEAGHQLNTETWRAMRGFADLVACLWREPDSGIWELRDDARHHVHSKLMAWLALDRALRIADTHRVSDRQRQRWREERDSIADEVRTRGFDQTRGSYTRSYHSGELDAALLVLPLLGIDAADSDRVRTTIDAVACELDAGGPLIYRYPPGRDGLPGGEGAFVPCAFWLVQALALTGRRHEAKERLAALVELANPLGLFAEELDPISGEHIGNYPQALTHAALVQAALALRGTPAG